MTEWKRWRERAGYAALAAAYGAMTLLLEHDGAALLSAIGLGGVIVAWLDAEAGELRRRR